ncbi:MAG TPA: endonuclease MutS2 [Trueperaceae bacterium]
MLTSPQTLERLSWGRVLASLADRAGTSLGAELARDLGPGSGIEAATAMHRRVTEVIDGGELSLGGIEDVRPLLHRVREGGMLDGREILSVAYTLDAAATLRRGIALSGRAALTELAELIGSFDGVLRLVREQLDVDGNVRDDATPKLRDIRQRLAPLRGQIRDRLNRLLEAHAADVQEPLITLRRDRYVIPVKASSQSRVPGIALDRSDSGATVFIEPSSVVPLNNELALLEMEERDEVRRILLALARRLADEPLVDQSLAAVARLDVVNAAARLAKEWRLTRPSFDDAGRVRLIAARHPLVEGCVPNDVELDAQRRLLIVTGPNAGGKTVLLKTVGLAAVMAHSGLFVAASAEKPALVPRLEELLTDIGDQQSIEASLSTYAGHLVNLKDIVERAGPRTLVLIDELGSGTDPDEGAALSQAILERVREGGSRGVVTTHLAPLKVFASESEGVVNAAMSFDLEALRPTYRLVVGQPGRSYALAIAERIGLDERLLARASELLGEEAGRLETLLATLEEQRAKLTAERDEARRSGEIAVKEAEVLREQIATLRAREEELLAAAAARAEELLGETLQRATKLKRAATSRPQERSKALEELQELRRAARDAARTTRGTQQSTTEAREDPWRPGALVHVADYNARGRVLEERGDAVLVQLGLVKVEVPKREAQPVGEETGAGTKRRAPVPAGPAPKPQELDVRGARVEEALEAVRDFIAETHALRSGQVRILHGKGTGALRDAIRQELKATRSVKSFADAVPYEGGHGVTVVELRD